jgi:hypothetical protein
MKRISGFLILLFLSLNLMATNAPKEIYTIQIGTFGQPKAEDFKYLSKVGMVYLESIPNSNLKRVLISKFEDKTVANTYLATVKNIGYEDAFITTRLVDDAKTVKTIQLGSYEAGTKIDLATQKTLGNVYTHIKANEVRVLVGFFRDITTAKIALDKARAAGFPSAFMKDTDIVWLQKVNQFEENFLSLGTTAPKPITNVVVPTLNTNTNSGTMPTITNGTRDVGTSFGTSSTGKASVAGLQEALKDDRKYTGTVDGVYGNETKTGLENFKNNDEVFKRYERRAEVVPVYNNSKGDVYSIQGNVDLIEFNPNTAATNLQTFTHPLAKVYTAYTYFTGLVEVSNSKEAVDNLMNTAIQEAFENYNGQARFNYNQRYEYKDLKMIIQHMAFIYDAMGDGPKIPCWLVESHNAELSQAFAGLNPPSFTECEGFESIKEVRILQAMAADMDDLSDVERLKTSKAEKQAYTARRTELYLNPSKISLPEQELYEMWHNNLLKAVAKNIEQDPLRKEILTSFEVTYFMVYEKLENHYKFKGFEETQAKALSLATLYAVVNYNLGDYITK